MAKNSRKRGKHTRRRKLIESWVKSSISIMSSWRCLLARKRPRARSIPGFPPTTDEPLDGFDRVYVADPFGNRIELLEPR